MKPSAKIIVGIVFCAVVGTGIFKSGMVPWYSADPGGTSRRNPTSMHSHQKDWPIACHDEKHTMQSPVAITSSLFSGKEISTITPVFTDTSASLVDVGHTFQVRFPKPGGTLDFEGTQYQLKQFHFHKPSEHMVDGKQYEMEVHFVFVQGATEKSPAKIFVLGFPIDRGLENEELAKVWKYLPSIKEGYGEDKPEKLDWENAVATSELQTESLNHSEKQLQENIAFNVSKIIPSKANFYIYEGSLTTPSCDEGVTHAFSLSPMQLSDHQMEHFEGYYEGNNRDIQSVGNPISRNFRRASMEVHGL